MALDTFTLIASQYALEEDALDDYDAVRAAYQDLASSTRMTRQS
jgi:hypothetical protein